MINFMIFQGKCQKLANDVKNINDKSVSTVKTYLQK